MFITTTGGESVFLNNNIIEEIHISPPDDDNEFKISIRISGENPDIIFWITNEEYGSIQEQIKNIK